MSDTNSSSAIYTATTSVDAGADRAQKTPSPPPIVVETNLSPTQWGMLSFLASEVAFFATLIVAYLTFLGKDKVGPTPSEALSLPLVLCTTFVLLSSSVTIHFAERRLRSGDQAGFRLLWTATIALGAVFLMGTAYEWRELITRHHLTISRNLFGTTYYTLVGFHGLHVTAGVIVMVIMLGLALGRQVTARNRVGIEMVSWYWHFVDGVWVVVFTVVYLVGR
jgi:cytochrome c oxidase subunit III